MIKIIKLVTGETIIGKLDMTSWIIEKPGQLVMFEQDGEPQMSIRPYFPFGKHDQIQLNPESVIFTSDPNDQIKNFYIQASGSQEILTPPEKKIIL